MAFGRPPAKTADTHVSCFVVSEGTGWAARLRRELNARLEEMPFRSGVALFAAVLTLTGTGVALTVTTGGGHGAAAASAASGPGSTTPPSSADAVPSPSAYPSAAPGTPALRIRAGCRRRAFAGYDHAGGVRVGFPGSVVTLADVPAHGAAPVLLADLARAGLASAEPAARVDPAQLDPAQLDPAQLDPAQLDPARVEPALAAEPRVSARA